MRCRPGLSGCSQVNAINTGLVTTLGGLAVGRVSTSSPSADRTASPAVVLAQQSAARELPAWAVAIIAVGASLLGVLLCAALGLTYWCKHRGKAASSALGREDSAEAVLKELDEAFPTGEAAGAKCATLTEVNIEMSGLSRPSSGSGLSPRPFKRMSPPPLAMPMDDGESCYVPEGRHSPGSTLYLPDDVASTVNFAALAASPEEDVASVVSAAPTQQTCAVSVDLNLPRAVVVDDVPSASNFVARMASPVASDVNTTSATNTYILSPDDVASTPHASVLEVSPEEDVATIVSAVHAQQTCAVSVDDVASISDGVALVTPHDPPYDPRHDPRHEPFPEEDMASMCSDYTIVTC